MTSDSYRFSIDRTFEGNSNDRNVQATEILKPQKLRHRLNAFSFFPVRPGVNNIERRSTESVFTMPDTMPMNMFMEKLNKAISGSAPFMYSDRQFGFSERLTLPKGKPEGMKYKMFFFLSPFDEGNMHNIEYPMFGKFLSDGKAPGFPLDRPMYAWNYTIPNMAFKDVMIYNLVQ